MNGRTERRPAMKENPAAAGFSEVRPKPSGSFAPARHRAHQAEAASSMAKVSGSGTVTLTLSSDPAVGILGTECCEAEGVGTDADDGVGVLLPVVGAGVVGAAQRGAVRCSGHGDVVGVGRQG